MGYIPPSIEEASTSQGTLLWYRKQRVRLIIIAGVGLISTASLMGLVFYFKAMIR